MEGTTVNQGFLLNSGDFFYEGHRVHATGLVDEFADFFREESGEGIQAIAVMESMPFFFVGYLFLPLLLQPIEVVLH